LLVAQIVRGFVAHNTIPPGELPNLIATVHSSFAGLGQPVAPAPREPAVAINRSYNRNIVICLDCGWRGQMLRRHLTMAHSLSPAAYRARWNLKATHPLTAPGYSERRSTLAKQFDLGRSRPPAESALDPTFTASLSQPKRRGRPRNTAPAPAPAPAG
jgi:predicted transcriptional regulator